MFSQVRTFLCIFLVVLFYLMSLDLKGVVVELAVVTNTQLRRTFNLDFYHLEDIIKRCSVYFILRNCE